MSNFTNFFKTGVTGTYSNTDTLIQVVDASVLIVPCTIVIFDEDFNNPLNAYKNNKAEIVTVNSKNVNELNVTRGQEGTTALTIGSGSWQIIQTITSNALDSRFYTETEIDSLLLGKSNTGHTHTESDITDLDKYTQAEVDGFLNNKSNTGHTHTESDITDLQNYVVLGSSPNFEKITLNNNELGDHTGSGDIFYDASEGLYIVSTGGSRLAWTGENVSTDNFLSVTYNISDNPTIGLNSGITSKSSAWVANSSETLYYRFTGGSNVNMTINSGTYNIGDVIYIEQSGTGVVTVVAGTSVTVNGFNGGLKTGGQYDVIAVKQVSSNVWTCIGGVA